MTTHQDITARLWAEAAGIEEWAIMDPATGAYCMWFDRDESVNPAREAEAWLAQHKRDWPEKFGKYEVVRQVRKSQRDLMEIEAADEIDRLRAEVEALKRSVEVGKQFGDLWYFAMDEAPREFEHIVATHQPKGWMDAIAKIKWARDAARKG